MSGRAIERARAGWGDGLPDWVEALANRCDETTQAATARDIGISPATVNQILGGRYAGDMRRMGDTVRETVMTSTVACPQLGEVDFAQCMEWQRKSAVFAATGATRQRMRRACPKCPNWKGLKNGE